MSTNPQLIPLEKLDDHRRAELATEVVDRVLDQTLLVLEDMKDLKLLVRAFSVRHGRAVDAAMNTLLDALEALAPDLESVSTHPETWNRHN
ncbi:hypothetical protein [Microbacterium candidum]|uniref:ANTAR domain-containing protein n=1 Tax=Microbacterium candidum TaxID=3041922 RepID=A0ABT7N061_9MICO|nr:hypothetical protein [Microbacterium sp. ASV49]MDL9980093.1 hypothetical protein [Microbacterium sp. ASV49]